MGRPCPHCGATHSTPTDRCPATGLPIGGDAGLIGSTIAGRYHLVRLLGDGGRGAVYKAADRVLRRFVALKLLHEQLASRTSTVERFVREARAAAAIGHPNIVDVLDFGSQHAVHFLVMEYLRGRPLSHAIAHDGPFGVGRACTIAAHTLAGLAAAHEQGILHRDLKPANLMLTAHLGDRDFVKICDFGFATLLTPNERLSSSHRSLTPERTLVGTPAYAAPERLRGDDRRDPRIDVYSVGVLLFEMLIGTRPFRASSVAELARKVRNQPPPSLREQRGDISPALEQVVHRALAKDPDERWSSAEALAEALVPFGGRPVPRADPTPTETFTMDLVKIRARETARQRSLSTEGADAVLARVRKEHGGATGGQTAPDDSTTVRDAAPPHVESEWTAVNGATAATDTDASTRRREPPTAPPQHTDPAGADPAAAAAPAAAPIPTSNRAFESSLVIAMLRFVGDRFGERALKQVLDELPGPAAAVFAQGISAGAWVPADAVIALLERIDWVLGRGDMHMIVRCGRAAADGALPHMRQLRPPGPPPELLLAEMPTLMGQLARGIEYRVRRVGRGYGRLEVVESAAPSLSACVASLGFVERGLARFGATDVEVNLMGCRALGDPGCLLDVSWLS